MKTCPTCKQPSEKLIYSKTFLDNVCPSCHKVGEPKPSMVHNLISTWKKSKGFTLIEILLTVSFIAISVLGITIPIISQNEVIHQQVMIRTVDQYANDVLEWVGFQLKNCDSVTVNNHRLDIYTTDFMTNKNYRMQFRWDENQFKVNNDNLFNTNFDKATSDKRDKIYIQKVEYVLSKDNKLLSISINVQYYRNNFIQYDKIYKTKVFIRNYQT